MTDSPQSATASDPTPWMNKMREWIGEAEATGTPPTEFDRMVFAHTNFGDLGNALQPSCAATACAALELTGYSSPRSAAAIDFADYGDLCILCPGCIVVFQWQNGDHHVSFVDQILNNDMIKCLGGNQSKEVKDSVFGTHWVIASRWPRKAGQ